MMVMKSTGLVGRGFPLGTFLLGVRSLTSQCTKGSGFSRQYLSPTASS